MIVSAGAVARGRIVPIVEAYLQERALGNSRANFHCAAIEVSNWNGSPRRCRPEVPDAVGTFSDFQDRRLRISQFPLLAATVRSGAPLGLFHGDRIMLISPKPRLPPIRSSAYCPTIIV